MHSGIDVSVLSLAFNIEDLLQEPLDLRHSQSKTHIVTIEPDQDLYPRRRVSEDHSAVNAFVSQEV